MIKKVTPAVTVRPLNVIAREIRKEWQNVYFGAVPHLDAMGTLTDKTSMYGCDNASYIVNYFLSNARSFRGEAAKRIKIELKAAIK